MSATIQDLPYGRTAAPIRVSGIMPLAVKDSAQAAPQGWSWTLLSKIAKLESGHTPSRNHPEWWGGDIPWLALPDIRELDGKVAFQTSEYINREGLAHSSARLLPAGTVCLSRTASVGYITMMGIPMATSQDFVNWVCGPQLHPPFLALLLRRARSFIRSLSSGAVHKTVYMPTVKAFRVCVPGIDDQIAIADQVQRKQRAIETLTAALAAQREALNRLPDAILRQAFNGEL